MDTATFNVAIAEIVEEPTNDFKHPFLTVAKFIFADDKPNENNQGIEREDFKAIAQSSIDMPVKMLFTGTGVGNHLGSYVIGHIRNMVESEDKLVAEAVLYKEEFPEEIGFLQQAHASGDAPGVSYEIIYEDSIFRDGIQWLKKAYTTAATFVRTPAYGKRTALLALASAKDDTQVIPTLKAYIAQAEESGEGNKLPNEGGINVDELEKAKTEAATFKAEAETKTAEISKLNESLQAKDDAIKALTEEVTTLKQEKVMESRVRALAEAGFPLEADAEKADKKKAFISSLSDDAFAAYLDDIKAVKASATAQASASGGSGVALASLNVGLPRPNTSIDSGTPTIPSFRFNEL